MFPICRSATRYLLPNPSPFSAATLNSLRSCRTNTILAQAVFLLLTYRCCVAKWDGHNLSLHAIRPPDIKHQN